MKNKKNGFTLIELLATITLIGIMMAIAIVGVSKLLGSSRTNFYKTLEKNISLAAQTYAENNRNILPKRDNTQITITLKTLVDNNYIKSVVDHTNKACDLNNSKITITRKKAQKYTYMVDLKCPGYKK